MTQETDQPRLAAVSVKLPPFWPLDSQLWFAQVQAQFAIPGITSQKTMFDYVIASFAPEFAAEIRDLILTPPAETPYDVLKKHSSKEQQPPIKDTYSNYLVLKS